MSGVFCLPHLHLRGSQEPLPHLVQHLGHWGASLYRLIIRLPPQVPAVLISATGMGAMLSSLPQAGAVGRVGTEAVAGLGSQQPVPFLLSTLARPVSLPTLQASMFRLFFVLISP